MGAGGAAGATVGAAARAPPHASFVHLPPDVRHLRVAKRGQAWTWTTRRTRGLALLRVGGASGTAGRDSKAGGSVSGSGSLRTSRGGVSARHRPKISKTTILSRAGTRELAGVWCASRARTPRCLARRARGAGRVRSERRRGHGRGHVSAGSARGRRVGARSKPMARDALARGRPISQTNRQAAYARDPDLASRKADAFKRLTIEKEMEALRDAMGPIDTGAFGLFRERAVALAALARRKSERRDEGEKNEGE